MERVTDYMEYLRASVDSDPMGEDTSTLTGLPYCGCYTCDEREYGYAMVLEALKGAGEGLVELVPIDE